MKHKLSRRIIFLAVVVLINCLSLAWQQTGIARIANAQANDSTQSSAQQNNDTQGSLVALDATGKIAGLCPLKHTSVKAEISGFLSRVTVTQEFENNYQEKIDAVYKFPLPQAAAVDDMTMLVGERTIRGKIMRREEAKTAYNEARARGQIASLLDQERPNIFTQSVANILPGQGIKIVISYVETLKYEAGAYEWSFPMVVAPRYIPARSEDQLQQNQSDAPTQSEPSSQATSTQTAPAQSAISRNESAQNTNAQSESRESANVERVPDAARITPPVVEKGMRAGHDISIEVVLDAGVPIDNFVSTTHEIESERQSERRAIVRLKDRQTIPNKDFTFRYDVAGGKIEDALLTHRSANGGFFTFILQPPDRVTVEDVTPKELVFVLDTSGSMQGFPLDKAKETMSLALANLNPQDTFNVITFSGDTKVLFSAPVPATAENVRRAKKFLDSRESDGGTEMMKAIRAALAPSDAQTHLRIACFMTDGEVGNDMEILAEVQKHQNARVFAIGFGSAPNRFLLDKMAEYGRGEVDYVTDEKGDGAATIARRFHERVRNPLLTDLSIDWSGLPVSDIYPQRLPDLFSAKPVIVSGRYTGAAQGRILLRGKMSGRDFVREIPVTLPENEPQHDVLATLWARRKVDDLMSRDMNGLQAGTTGDELREAITKLGLDYRLMTQFTSFVAIEDRVVTDGSESRTVEVPVEMPASFVTSYMTTVDVSGSAATIDATDSKIQTIVTTNTVETLPRGTNFTSLLQVASAVRNEPLSGGFQIDGASGSENTFIIDGQEVTNFRTGALNTTNDIPFPIVQEIQVKSSGLEAEFGAATGGIVSVVTKSGTNDYHGEFGIGFRPGGLQAAAPPALRLFTTNAPTFFQRAEYLSNTRDRGLDLFPTANLGGAIKRDRAWFFVSYSPQLFSTVRDVSYISSDPRNRMNRFAETYRAQTLNQYAFSRLDYSVTDSLRVTGTFMWNPVAYKGLLPSATQQVGAPAVANIGNGTLSGADLLAQQGGRINSNNVTGNLAWTPTSRMVLNLRGGRSFLNEKVRFDDGVFSYGVPRAQRFVCAVGGAEAGCDTDFENFPTNELIDYDVSIRRTLDADASYIADDFGGRHMLKFGYQFNGVGNNVSSGNLDFGATQLFYGVPLKELSGNPTLAATPGAIGSGFLERNRTKGSASGSNQSLYMQDSWQPFDRLTLNLGLRAERETVPGYNESFAGIKLSFADKLAPRLGFAYDATGDGKTKIYGFYGWYYDRFKYELPRKLFGGEFLRRDYFELFAGAPLYTNYTTGAILGNRPDVAGGNCPTGGIVGGTGLSRCQIDFRVAANNETLSSGVVDPDLNAFRQSEITFGVERALGDGFLLAARFTHKQIDRAVEDIGFFNAQGSVNYIIGNPGEGASVSVFERLGLPPTAKARRDYDALELRLDKRFSGDYYFNASYTLSRLFGNFPGLSDSDADGRNRPNATVAFDLPFVAYNADGTPNDGRLPTDRPHVFKFYGSYLMDWSQRFGFGRNHSTEFSGFTQASSGTPLTTRFLLANIGAAILNGRGDLGRTEAFTQTDFALRHKYRFGNEERFTLAFDVDLLNAFNERNALGRAQLVNARVDYLGVLPGETAAERVENFFRLGTLRNLVNADLQTPGRLDATFNQPDVFQSPRSIRFGLRLLF